VNNFGDLLGPLVVDLLLGRHGVAGTSSGRRSRATTTRLLSVGSIMHFARDGDTVWGSGVNGKVPLHAHSAHSLDVRAVRGPLTARWLREKRGIEAPPVYGDPALLIPTLLPGLKQVEKTASLTVIPNLNERETYASHPAYLDPRGAPLDIVRHIASSEVVVASSLHGFVIAEALGVPAALLKTDHEPAFKYLDYLLGTGRDSVPMFTSVERALDHARGLDPDRDDPLANWAPDRLIESFPSDLWLREDQENSTARRELNNS